MIVLDAIAETSLPREVPANENLHEDQLDQSNAISVGGSANFWALKRSFDSVLSIFLLFPLLFLALVLLVLNPLFNPGPLLYTQVRIGRYGRSFSIFKFRTMLPAADSREIFDAEDDRVKPLGRFLRKFRIDELPQIYNVLRGEMSLIGPRPEMIEIVEKFEGRLPGFSLRHAVRPGISGLSQVTVGYTACEFSYTQKLESDLTYIRRAGWDMEWYIFSRTLWVVFTGYGAR